LLARQSRIRLEAEIVRDIALTASGLLSARLGGPGVFPPKPDIVGLTPDAGPWVADKGENRYRRGLYTTIQRSAPHTVLLLFDAPDPTQSCTRRNHSNTPLQALALLNDEAFHEFAQGLAKRMMSHAAADQIGRLRYGFSLCLGRPPDSSEEDRLQAFLARQTDEFHGHPEEARSIVGSAAGDSPTALAPWVAVARVLLNLDEFITRE
ncbi:MAG: DUF1553 domain-containing protein, partial [Acidobacteria bacterium]|nr:DUF1553 domain-containing protein [Acidobacteriota bacterium]